MEPGEVIEAVCAVVEAGDVPGIASLWADDGVLYGTIGGIDEQLELHGPAAIASYYSDVAGTWDEWRLESERILRNGDTFVIFWRETNRARQVEVRSETASVLVVRDGKIAEGRGYLDRAAALAAAGLA